MFRTLPLVAAMILLPFMGQLGLGGWAIGALLLMALWLVIDSQRETERLQQRLDNMAAGQGSDPQSAEAPQAPTRPTAGPWRDRSR